MTTDYSNTNGDLDSPLNSAIPADKISSIAEVAQRRGLSITFIRKEIKRGRLRAVVLAPDSHRKKVRIFYRDELAWLESSVAQLAD